MQAGRGPVHPAVVRRQGGGAASQLRQPDLLRGALVALSADDQDGGSPGGLARGPVVVAAGDLVGVADWLYVDAHYGIVRLRAICSLCKRGVSYLAAGPASKLRVRGKAAEMPQLLGLRCPRRPYGCPRPPQINEWLVERDNRGTWALLIAGTAISFAGGLVLTGVTYHYYAPASSCSLNIFFITWNLVLGLLMVGVLFVPGRAPTAGLLTSGAVWLYCSYLTYSALASEPANRCTRGGGVSAGGWVGVVAFFIALAAVIYSTLDAGTASRDMFGGKKSEAPDDESGELPYRADFFHLVFATASCYLAMLFTNWAVSQSATAFEIGKGWASTWVKIVSSWVCALLYSWTVIAPAILKDRDFGFPV
ncbi:hypothetical protein Vretifemale_13749 [Volvox reticuliferus]|uniref:Uncharacterized protein n=1 Tax=Volvox reticuliferus TaxID=1737510 RepID=A0A8J4FUS1_9CHLO|nr:hypothetical protein Vretifemale_13749 [Volvox reticuliferus]